VYSCGGDARYRTIRLTDIDRVDRVNP